MYFRVSECKSTGNNRHISHFESLRFGRNPVITKKTNRHQIQTPQKSETNQREAVESL